MARGHQCHAASHPGTLPIAELARFDDEDELPYRPGFAILALDCLLIDTIQSSREGRVTTGDVSSAQSFKNFLSSPRFTDFAKNDRGEFFQYVRNAILHNGETRKDWKIRIDAHRMLERDPVTRTRTINRQHFHAAIEAEFQDLVAQLRAGNVEARRQFLRRMDAMAGIPIEALRNFYFAYGSNLKDKECRRTAPTAEAYAVAFLPSYRLEFTKHSTTRNGDAATIEKDPTSMVWGYVYRISDEDREALRKREGGYAEVTMTVYLMPPTADDDPTAQEAFTFIANQECSEQCGPPAPYLELIIQGSEERELPEAYRQALKDLRKTVAEPSVDSSGLTE
jgi:cation transport regulator ChaC